MKKLILALVFVGLLVFTAGCEESGPASSGSEPDGRPAMAFQDGHKKYYDHQFQCPVCGKEGLKPDIHVDLEQGRMYFDKEECKKEFNQDQEKYLQKFEQMKRGPGGGPQGGQ